MTKSSKKPFSDREVTRDDVLRLCERLKNDKPKLRKYLVVLFAKPENIHLFGWFINRRYIKLETPDFHKEMLRLCADKSNTRIGFVAPRGHAKSTTVNWVYALWSACYEQHRFAVLISDTYSQAEEFVNALRDEFTDNAVLKWLYGDLSTDLWRDGEFKLSNGIKFVAKGSGQRIRGIRDREARPDLMLFDDIENDENVASVEQRKKLYNWFTKAALQALSRDGRAILVGTILHFDSLVNKVAKKDGVFTSWLTKVYYAITTDKNGNEQALWPEHMSLEYLKAIRSDIKHPNYVGSITFAQEYQHKPFDEEDAIVKPDQVVWVDSAPDSVNTRATALAIDPAASEKTAADPTGKVVGSLGADGKIYIKYVGNERLSPGANNDDIRRLNDVYQPNRIGIESGALGLVFRDLLAGLPVIGMKPDTDKVRRLLSVSRFFEAGKICFVKGAKNTEALFDQLVEFPRGRHDDMVDALVYVIKMLLVDGLADISQSSFETTGDYDPENGDDGWSDY